MWLLAIAGFLIAASLVRPISLRYPYRVWMLIGHCLGWVNTRVLMAVLFYGIVTPAAVFMRLLKRDTMGRSFDPAAASYRVIKTPRSPEHVTHPF